MDFINSLPIFWIILLAAVVYLGKKSVVQVPQSYVFLVQRFGKYTKTLQSGINFIVPFLDEIDRNKPIPLSEQQMTLNSENVITSDNVRLKLQIQSFYRITDASHYHYRIQEGALAIEKTIDATVRALAGRRTIDQLNADRLQLTSEIAVEVNQASNEWGVMMSRVEITNIHVIDQEFVDSMHRQAQAERERRGTVIEAEAEAQKIKTKAEASAFQIRMEADAELYRAQKEAEAIKVLAEAEAWALSTKGKSLESQGGISAQQSEIMRAQVEALKSLGGAENSKLVVIPTDLVQAAASFGNLFAKK